MTDRSIVPGGGGLDGRIFTVRGQRVMLDSDLAAVYGVPTKRLNEQVRRNAKRFPADFMFRLTWEEAREVWAQRSQNATLDAGRGKHRKHAPYAFTEHGAVMLATVLNSPIAVRASVEVVRAFVRMREMLAGSSGFARRLDELERQYTDHDKRFAVVFDALRALMDEAMAGRKRERIGFRLPGRKR